MKRYGRLPKLSGLGDQSSSFQSGAYAAGMNAMYLQAQPGSGMNANQVITAALANPALNNTSYSNASGSLVNDVAAINAATAPGAPGVTASPAVSNTPAVNNTPTTGNTPATSTTVYNAQTPAPTQVHLTDPYLTHTTVAGAFGYLVNGQKLTDSSQIPNGFIAVGYTPNGSTVYGPPGSPQGIYDFSSGKITDASGRLIGLISSGAPIIGYDDKGNALTNVPSGFVQIGTATNGLPIYGLAGGTSGGGSSATPSDTSSALVGAGQKEGGGSIVWVGLALLAFLLFKG